MKQMTLSTFTHLLMIGLIVSCGKENREVTSEKVLLMEGGSRVDVVGSTVGPFPSLVGYTYSVNGNPNILRACSGAFIEDNIILTAAHCFDSIDINPTTINLVLSNGSGLDVNIKKL